MCSSDLVLRLGTITLRDDNDVAFAGNAIACDFQQAREHCWVERLATPGMETQLHGRGYLVDVLSARPGSAYKLFIQITFVNVDFARNSHARSLIGTSQAGKTHRMNSTGYCEVCVRRGLATAGHRAPIDGAQGCLGILLE